MLYQLSYRPPMNGSRVGLEPTTHGLSGNCVLLYDHLKLQSQRLPPPKGTASHPRRGRGTGDLVASLGLTTNEKDLRPLIQSLAVRGGCESPFIMHGRHYGISLTYFRCAYGRRSSKASVLPNQNAHSDRRRERNFSQEQKARTHRAGHFDAVAGVVPPFDGSHPSCRPITLPVFKSFQTPST